MRRYFVLLMLALVSALVMAQSENTNKGAHYLEVKTGLSISDVTSNPINNNLVKGMSFDMRYAYGLIENLDIVAAYSAYSGYRVVRSFTLDVNPYLYVDPMYYCNALQVGVRGKLKCFNFMNLKLSLTGGFINCAYTRYSEPAIGYQPYPYAEMYLRPCLGGMFEVDFDITERMSLGLFFGRTTSILNKNLDASFDNTGVSLSVRL